MLHVIAYISLFMFRSISKCPCPLVCGLPAGPSEAQILDLEKKIMKSKDEMGRAKLEYDELLEAKATQIFTLHL